MARIMANRRQSIKKIRVDIRRREHNLRVISELRSVSRKVSDLIAEKNKPEAAKASRILFSKLDKAVKKGVIHKNRASRRKSRVSLKIQAL